MPFPTEINSHLPAKTRPPQTRKRLKAGLTPICLILSLIILCGPLQACDRPEAPVINPPTPTKTVATPPPSTTTFPVTPTLKNTPAATPAPVSAPPTPTITPPTPTPKIVNSPEPAVPNPAPPVTAGTAPSGTPEITSTLNALKDLKSSTQLVSREFKWEYGKRQWTLELQISKLLYDYYKALPRSPTRNFSVYVTHPLDDEYIGKLVNELRDYARQAGYDEYETVSFMAAFVQSLPYTSDSVTTGYDEYPRYPIETLVDNGGDCEDTAILMAALVKTLDYGVVLLIFPQSAQTAGHCAVGIKGGEGIYGTSWSYSGAKYYYLETTGTGWKIGETPKEYKAATARIYAMVPVPILTHNWSYSGTTRQLKLQVIVDNLGSAAAPGVYVNTGFDAGDNTWWNAKESPVSDIAVDGSVTYTMYLTPPRDKYTRLIVKIMYNGYSADISYSKWFNTN
jgi:hypothetical protein